MHGEDNKNSVRVLIATPAPERFSAWLPFLEAQGMQVRTAAADLPAAPEVVLLDLVDGGCRP